MIRIGGHFAPGASAAQTSNSPKATDESAWRAIPRPSLASSVGLGKLDAWTAASERRTLGGGSVLVPQGAWLALRIRPEPRPSQSRVLGAFGRAQLCADEEDEADGEYAAHGA